MYAVGWFTEIVQGSTTYTRKNIFSFSATAPYTMTRSAPTWSAAPVTASTRDQLDRFRQRQLLRCLHRREFTSVNGTAVKNIAEINTTTGAVV